MEYDAIKKEEEGVKKAVRAQPAHQMRMLVPGRFRVLGTRLPVRRSAGNLADDPAGPRKEGGWETLEG